MTRSPSLASITSRSYWLSSRAASEAVNFSGMCWTMTMPGVVVRPRPRSTTSIDCTPPVDRPIATTRSVVRLIACCTAGGRITGALPVAGR